jgi:murein DD-endopeptidase MepM/ murein hydrolase activator NlpD
MLAALRRPAFTRSWVIGLLAVSAAGFPGASAVAEPVPAYRVVPGTTLHPVPPRFVLPVAAYRLTGRFGDRSSLWSSVHTGLDFAAPSGTAIHTIADGRVLSVGYDGSYGNKTVLQLADGTELWFCHQSRIDVRVGERVHLGEVIGAIGSTGNVTGPHLHLEVRPRTDDPVDPLTWLRSHGLRP